MSGNNFYLLDNNVLISIGPILNGGVDLSTGDWQKRQQLLRSIDKEGNFISGMLAAIEGQVSQEESPEQKKETIAMVADTLDNFFSNAKTDAYALRSLSEDMSQLGFGTHEWSYEECAKFRDAIFPDLIQTPKKEKIPILEDKFLDIARKNAIQLAHPVVLCALSALYGKNETRDVLKVNKEKDRENSYNALSDVYAISRIPMLSTHIFRGYPNHGIQFITFDKGLKFFYDSLRPISISETIRSDRSDIATTMIVSKDLFPGISDEHFVALEQKILAG